MAKGESRGGGYDLATDKKTKQALGNQTQQNIGAMANARQVGASQEAPKSIGELMSPSTFGREGPPVDEADLQQRTERNKGFLSDPATQAMLLQFGVKMLSGGNPGDAIRSAMQMPSRMAAASAKAEEAGLDITQKKLNIMKTTKELTQGKESTPTEMMKLLTEAQTEEANGNTENASMLRSRAYQLSQEFSAAQGQILVPPKTGNAGVAGEPELLNVKGGKADLEAQAASQAIADAKMTSIQQGALMGSAIDDINRIIAGSTAPDFLITGFGSNLKLLGGTDAANVDALLNTVKANVGFTKLQEMRNASKTGGALGQVSDYENKLLQSVLAALEQGQTRQQFQKNLATVKFLYDPSYIDARGELSKALEAGTITKDEAKNKFDAMFREAVHGPDIVNQAAPLDLTVPPAYIEERFKPIWNAGTPAQKRALLTDEDKAKFDAMQAPQQ